MEIEISKESSHLLCSGSEVKCAFVEKNRRQYGVPALCEALQISRSGYYAAWHRGPGDRQKRQVDLTARIRTIHQASRESYGAPGVHVELLAQAVPCCRNTVAKLMHKAGILPNAPMESLFHTPKTELVVHCDYKTRDDARASLFDHLEVSYNRQRRHSSIGYEAPLPFEAMKSPGKLSTVRGWDHTGTFGDQAACVEP